MKEKSRTAGILTTTTVVALLLMMMSTVWPLILLSLSALSSSAPFTFISYATAQGRVVVNDETFTTELVVVCETSSISWTDAKTKCNSMGVPGEYSMVASTSASINTALVNLTNQAIWLGGYEANLKFNWVPSAYHPSPLDFSQYSGGASACYANSYCNWEASRPLDKIECGGYNDWLMMLPGGQWRDYNKDPSTGNNCIHPQCYGCQRFLCSISKSCDATHTMNVTGNYPNCVCQCITGYGGPTCAYPTTDNINYTSLYTMNCSVTAITRTDADQRCKAIGAGWRLATVATAAAAARKTQLSTNAMWIDGLSIDTTHDWRWSNGRLASTPVSTGPFGIGNWKSGTPRPTDICSTNASLHRWYLAADDAARFYDQYNDVSCDASAMPKCSLCEYQPCIMSIDCDATHTVAVSEYYGTCKCDCAAGYDGARCNISTLVYSATYVSEYLVACEVSPMLSRKSTTSCLDRGSGWRLASAPNSVANDVIRALLVDKGNGVEYTWLSGYKDLSWFWASTTIRTLSNYYFTNNDTCVAGSYCNFAPGAPSYPYQCYDTDSKYLIMFPNGTWKNVLTTVSTGDGCFPTRCYACERSSCNVSADCFIPGATNASGYYPSCTCTCKPGFSGSTCATYNFSVSDMGPVSSGSTTHYSSNFTAVWQVGGGMITLDAARRACKSTGRGWDLGTMPNSNTVMMLMNVVNTTFTMWISASDSWGSTAPGNWYWTAGRLAGTQFSTGATATNSSYVNWGSGFPRAASDPTCDGQRRSFVAVRQDGTWVDVYNVTNASSTCNTPTAANPSAYLCEMSPCIYEVECDVSHSTGVTGGYGSCQCLCSYGWSGARCNKRPIVYNDTFSTEYTIVCTIDGNVISYESATSLCSNHGDGWGIAAVPSQPTNDMIASMIFGNAWLGGQQTSTWSTNKGLIYDWGWFDVYKGRSKNKIFASRTSCITGSFCNFDQGMPLYNYRFDCGANNNLIMLPNGKWQDIGNKASNLSTCFPTRCAACERSACNMTADCFTKGTINATGWYPNCKCNCKTDFSGDKCDTFSFTATNDAYTSEYVATCKSTPMTYAEAVSMCQSRGLGNYLASLSSTAATAALMNVTSALVSMKMWTGGLESLTQRGAWMWSTGRKKDVQFSQGGTATTGNYANWGSTPPRPTDSCGNATRNALVVSTPSGGWSDQYSTPSSVDAMLACDNNIVNWPHCVLCEASPCVLSIDCETANTVNVSGVFGICKCHCVYGWGGLRCQVRNVVYSPTYVTEYSVGCNADDNIYRYSAILRCNSMGSGWSLAAAPNAEANNVIHSMTSGNTWLSATIGFDRNYNNVYIWANQYGPIRERDQTFASTTGCSPNVFCNFTAGRPNMDDYDCGYRNYLLMLSNGSWIDASWNSACFITRCYACQRSPCNITADCFTAGTDNTSGYFPDCKCNCKLGFSGDLCNIYTVNQSTYISEYRVVCTDDGSVVTYSGANNLCRSKSGLDWAMATTPNTQSTTGIVTLAQSMANTSLIWLGGSDQYIDGLWQWNFGRLAKQVFYNSANTSAASYVIWTPNRPNNETCDGKMTDYLTLVNFTQWVDSYLDTTTCTPASQSPQCVACERQPCNIAVDCDVLHSTKVSGYYPECSCICHQGWGGKRCSINVIVDNGGYTSEYYVGCNGRSIDIFSSKFKCQYHGDGWALASLPTPQATAVVANLTDLEVWLGGEQVTDTNSGGKVFQWNTPQTRAYGTRFATSTECLNGEYCNFAPGFPIEKTCGYFWNMRINGKMVLSSVNTSDPTAPRYWIQAFDSTSIICQSTPCYACERSPCNIPKDCATEGTDKVTGYYPKCVCTCKFGYVGDKCDVDGFVDVGTYQIALWVKCQGYSIPYDDAISGCRALGDGWDLGTVPNQAANVVISQQTQNATWVAGRRDAILQAWSWRAGRLSNTSYFGTSCQQTRCFWTNPDVGTSCFAAGGEKKYYMGIEAGTGTSRTWTTFYPKACGTQPNCYACEKSQCVLNHDCNATHAINVTGFYPACRCTCVAGWGGPRCAERVCNVETDCRGLATSVNGTWPDCVCIGCPKGLRSKNCGTVTQTRTLLQTLQPSESSTSSNDTGMFPTDMTTPGEPPTGGSMTTTGSGTGAITTMLPTGTVLCPWNVSMCRTESSFQQIVSMLPLRLPLDALRSVGIVSLRLLVCDDVPPVSVVALAELINSGNVSGYLSHDDGTVSQQLQVSFVMPPIDGAGHNRGNHIEIVAIVTAAVGVSHVTEPSMMYLHVVADPLVQACCGSKQQKWQLSAAVANNSLRIGVVELTPYAGVPIPIGPDITPDAFVTNGSVQGCATLLGSPIDDIYLRALSPFALLVTSDDGFSGIIASNLIGMGFIIVVHLIVVSVYKVRGGNTFGDACASASFPSMPIYAAYALLPGTAIAAGELTVIGDIVGIVTLIVVLAIMTGSGLVPYLYLSRGLYAVPLLPGQQRAKLSCLFPTTIVAPPATAARFAALVGNYRLRMPLWVTLPVWSSVLLLIGAFFQPSTASSCTALYAVLTVLHCVIAIIAIAFDPHTAMSLDALYCAGLTPLILLLCTRAVEASVQTNSATRACNVLLILVTIVNALRLAAAVCSPFKVFGLASYYNITDEPIIWVFDSVLGGQFKGFQDMEEAMLKLLKHGYCHGNAEGDEEMLYYDDASSQSHQSSHRDSGNTSTIHTPVLSINGSFSVSHDSTEGCNMAGEENNRDYDEDAN